MARSPRLLSNSFMTYFLISFLRVTARVKGKVVLCHNAGRSYAIQDISKTDRRNRDQAVAVESMKRRFYDIHLI